jgi:cellulose synthase/poly-beta-1,6-N-acetylglucosamine synthase-like glycosyltransferase
MIKLLLILYWVAVGLLTLYGINCHVMIFLFNRHNRQRREEDHSLLEQFYREHSLRELPVVTSQIPIYNELNVAERVIDAVVAFDYPQGKHQIQVLDDSTDETSQIIAQKVKRLKATGVQIEHIRRATREGFKAGALKHGLTQAKGEFLAIFDADFVPSKDFLLKSIPFLLMDPELGLVQGRWEHLNGEENFITRLQSLVLDGHFVIEQSARNWSNLFMNFNGTAGVFRKQAVVDVGNWESHTLTEDLELSYRMQIAGWKFRYLIDLVTPAEIPSDIQALKSQQFRWAMGSIQTAIKLLPTLWRSEHRLFKKLQGTVHLTHHLMHPLMMYLALAAPLLSNMPSKLLPVGFSMLIGCLGFLSFLGPFRMYWTAERFLYGGSPKRMWLLPFMICFGCGMAINNTRAVFRAFIAKKAEFIRTPKKGNLQQIRYKPLLNMLFLLEIAAGLWCLAGTYGNFITHHYVLSYFLFMYTAGFLYIGGLSFLHQTRYAR